MVHVRGEHTKIRKALVEKALKRGPVLIFISSILILTAIALLTCRNVELRNICSTRWLMQGLFYRAYVPRLWFNGINNIKARSRHHAGLYLFAVHAGVQILDYSNNAGVLALISQ